MTEYTSIRDQSCPNRACAFYGLTLSGNVWVHSRKDKRLKCRECGQTWVSYRHEPWYRLRADRRRLSRAVDLLRCGKSVRKTADLVGVSPSTIQRWKMRLGSREN